MVRKSPVPLIRPGWQRHLDNPVDNSYVISLNIPAGAGILPAGAGGNMKFPSMPGTGDFVPFDRPFPQGASCMRAGVVQGMNLSIKVEQGNAPILQIEAQGGA